MFLLVDFGSSKAPQIAETLRSLGYGCDTIKHEDFHYPLQKNYAGIIFSGSPVMLTEVPHLPFHEKYAPIVRKETPILGICFGHQVLGILHGAEIYRDEHIKRDEEIELLADDPLFRGLKKRTVMSQSHTEGITLPRGFIHLAFSLTYPVQAMKHPGKMIYGVQFHPEVSGENGRILLDNFCRLCG